LGDASKDARTSKHADPSAGRVVTTHDWGGSSPFQFTITFESNRQIPSVGEADGSTIAWISAGSSIAVLLLVLIAIIIILRCRDIASPTARTESDGMDDIPANGEVSSADRDRVTEVDAQGMDGNGAGRVLPAPDHLKSNG
jgi:hypothetical protein